MSITSLPKNQLTIFLSQFFNYIFIIANQKIILQFVRISIIAERMKLKYKKIRPLIDYSFAIELKYFHSLLK